MNPNKLYHYTSREGLIGILNSGYLRATQAWYLADGSECRLAFQLLKAIRPEYSETDFWKSVEYALLEHPRYVVCFSKIRNDPYQWKHYGGDGNGVCLELDTNLIRFLNPTDCWDSFNCIYDSEFQNNTIESFAQEVDKTGIKTSKDIECLNQFWMQNIGFKREEFSEENETRYVQSTQKSRKVTQAAIDDEDARLLAIKVGKEIGGLSHPSELFDERNRPFEAFEIKGTISEIILGSKFTTTIPYMQYLQQNYLISQLA